MTPPQTSPTNTNSTAPENTPQKTATNYLPTDEEDLQYVGKFSAFINLFEGFDYQL